MIFLAEAFTRPKMMYRPWPRLGFTQCYTYFTWRNFKQELTDYFTELTQTEVAEYFRPTLAQHPRHPARGPAERRPRRLHSRLVLAATLCSICGMYGPASSSARASRASRAARSTSTRRSTSSRSGTGTARTASRSYIARLNRDPPREPGPAASHDTALPPGRQRQLLFLQQAHRGAARTSSSWWSTSIRTTGSRAGSNLTLDDLGTGTSRARPSRCTT